MTDYQTDYNFPRDWGAMSAEEKNDWFLADRCRRQAERQAAAQAPSGAFEEIQSLEARWDRRADARNETVDLADYR